MSVGRLMLRDGRRSRVRRAVTRYRCARRAQRMPASRQSRTGLDWTNFFIADVQAGFGAFVAFYLAGLGWSQSSVGLALSAGGLAGVLGQIPGGALADAVRFKRALDFVSARSIFLAAAGLCAPALIALARIRADEIDYARARNAGTGEAAGKWHRVRDLARNRGLLLFAACLILFQLANASMLPLVGENLVASKAAYASVRMSGLIIGPQIVVALLAPWVGYFSELRGRKPLLLLGMGLEAVRAVLFAFVADYPLLVAIQLLDGVSGAIISVLTVLVITDLTTGTGRFNLAQSAIGTGTGIAAALSTSIFGFVFQLFGYSAGFLSIAGVAAVAAALAWLFLPETKPEKYID